MLLTMPRGHTYMLGILFYCSAFSYLVIVMFQLSDLLNYNQVVETIRYWAHHLAIHWYIQGISNMHCLSILIVTR